MVKILILADNDAWIAAIKQATHTGNASGGVHVCRSMNQLPEAIWLFSLDVIVHAFPFALYQKPSDLYDAVADITELPQVMVLAEPVTELPFPHTSMEKLDVLNTLIADELERKAVHTLKLKVIDKLEEHERLIQSVFGSPYEAAMLTKEGIVHDLSSTFTQLFGFTLNDLKGKSVFDFYLPEYAAVSKYHVLNNSRESYQLKFLDKEGNKVTTEVFGRPVTINGEVYRLTSFRNVTKLEDIEERIHARKERLLFEQKTLLNLVRDTHSNVENSIRNILIAGSELLTVERVSLWLFDSTETKLLCRLLYHGTEKKFSSGFEVNRNDKPTYFNYVQQHRYLAADDVFTHPITAEFIMDYLQPNRIHAMLDIPVWVHGVFKAIVCYEHTETARVWKPEETALATNLADIIANALCAEEQEKTLKRLLKSEIRLTEAQRVAGVGDWEYDNTTKTLLCSPETYRIHGREPQGNRISLYEYSRLIHPLDRNLFNTMIDKVFATKRSQRFEYRVLLPDGNSKYVHTQINVLTRNDETCIHGTILDLKNRHQVHNQQLN